MAGKLFFVSVIGFASGILCRSLFVMPLPAIFFSCLLALIIGIAWIKTKRNAYAAAALFLLLAALGAGRAMLAEKALPEAFVSHLDQHVTLEGIVIADADVRETSQRVTIRVKEGNATADIIAVASLYPDVGYGDHLRVSGTLARPEPFETDTGRTFRYDRFLAKDGIYALVNEASFSDITPPQDLLSRGIRWLFGAKHAFLTGISLAIPEPAASLAAGLIAGGKQGLGKELLQDFIIVGLVHIVVLSGYNVMIIAEAVLRALSFLPKRAAAVLAGLVIGLFVLLAGAGAASVRAGLMAGLGLIARATGRTYDVIRALFAAALLMLVLNPLLLANDPGFQLSFVATLGLVLGARPIALRLAFIRSEFVRELLSSTLAAEAAVLPLLLYQSGILSLVSLPANLLVLPFVPLAMALSACAGLAGILLPSLAPIAGLPAAYLLSAIIWVVQSFASLPFSSVTLPPFPFWMTAAVYMAEGALLARLLKTLKNVRT